MAATPAPVDFDISELYDSLVEWLQNCLGSKCDKDSLSNGVEIANCLVQLVPEYFTPAWKEKIISDTAGNWKLKFTNLKKIHRGVLEYYEQVLHISLEKFPIPNVAMIAEHESQADLARLLQLVLGVAINCDQKNSYIQDIMSMQQDVQHVVMSAIQDLMNMGSPSMVTGEDYKELEEQHKVTVEELYHLREEKDQMLQQIHDLQNRLRLSEEETSDLSTAVDKLKENLKEAQDTAGITGAGKAQQLNRQLDSLKAEKLRVEAMKDELKLKCQEMEVHIQKLVQKNQDLQLENEEIPVLKDSLEEMKYLESKVKNYESVISQYKKKLEDMQDMRRQMKSLEDKCMTYMQQNLDLEEENRRLNVLKSQLDKQKQKTELLENSLAKEKLLTLEATQDSESKEEVIETLKSEVVQLRKGFDMVKHEATTTAGGESLGLYFHRQSSTSAPTVFTPSSEDQPDFGYTLNEAFTPELREKMARLEKENDIIKRRLESRSSVSEWEGLGGGERGTAETEELRCKLADSEITISHMEKSVKEKVERLSRAEVILKELSNQVAGLEDERKSKDSEIEKYKKYLSKAKKIIESFGDKNKTDENVEIQTLKAQLVEKDKQIDKLQRAHEQDRFTWEREEKLIVSAWFEMGLKMHQKFSQERLLGPSSFLAQQRQALYKKPPPPINTSAPITSISAPHLTTAAPGDTS